MPSNIPDEERERDGENTQIPYPVSFSPYYLSIDMSTRAGIQTVLYMLLEIAVLIEDRVD